MVKLSDIIYSEIYLIGTLGLIDSLGGGVNKASFPVGTNEEFAAKVGLYFRRRKNDIYDCKTNII